MRTTTRTALIGGALLLPLALAACGGSKAASPVESGSPASVGAPAGVPTGVPTVGANQAPKATATPAGAPAQGTPSCKSSDFKADLSVQPDSPSGDTTWTKALMALTNKSGHACTLSGFPAVSVLDAANAPIKVPSKNVNQPGPPTSVIVQNGRSAFAGVKWADCDESDVNCAVATAVEITPPGLSGSVVADLTGTDGRAPDKIDVGSLQIGTVQGTSQGVVAW